jgi:hypothetical protein
MATLAEKLAQDLQGETLQRLVEIHQAREQPMEIPVLPTLARRQPLIILSIAPCTPSRGGSAYASAPAPTAAASSATMGNVEDDGL